MKKNRNSIKEKIEKFKELWKDEKYRAIIKLSIYTLFILILVLIVRLGGNVKPPVNINLTNNYVDMKNYEYEIIINNNKEAKKINGIKFNEYNNFQLDGIKYSIIDDKLYKTINEEYVESLFDINIVALFPNNIINYLKEENITSEIEYESNQTKKEYLIPNFNILNKSSNQVVITTYDTSKVINKIQIDISEIMKEKGFSNYNIEINYTNVNKIKNYKSS